MTLVAVRSNPVLFALGVLGWVAGIALWLCSIGTNDVRSWERFGQAIAEGGLVVLYDANKLFNHPPLMGWLAWLSHAIAQATGASFAVVFKALPLAGHIAGALVLATIWRQRGDERTGARVFALCSWSLASILVAAYHGNTDSLCAFFCLLSLYFLETRRSPFRGGLALAVAINVKIVPLLLVLPALAAFRRLEDARSFVLGVATAVLPFLVLLACGGGGPLANVFLYASSPEAWGVQLLLLPVAGLLGVTTEDHHRLAMAYHSWGRYLLIGAVVAWSVYGHRRRLDHARLMAGAFGLFLFLAPGFGVQYVAYLVPLMFAVSLSHGIRFSVWTSLFLAVVYAKWSIDAWPLESVYRPIRLDVALLGFAAWLTLPGFILACAVRPRIGGLRPVHSTLRNTSR